MSDDSDDFESVVKSSSMSDLDQNTKLLRDAVLAAPRKGKRRIVAIAGPPASGKSTIATNLADELTAHNCPTQVVPMDGFHLDNKILNDRKLLHRKGAPETFDVRGFQSLLRRIGDQDNVIFPIFDRTRDISIAGAEAISSECDTIIVEGNYLLLDLPIWRELTELWDFSISLNISDETLRERLVARWLEHGLSPAEALARAEENDLANARLVGKHPIFPDISI